MSLYRISPDRLEEVPSTTFAAENLLERRDLQRLLRENISVLGEELLVIAEEFGNWQDSNRRIDLLCLDKSAGLVVVEIKRTEDGGHMELQAMRYAAMVSSMTLDDAIQAYARSNAPMDTDAAREVVIEFLQSDDEEEVCLSGNVRILLVSADFSTEVTTTVLWLNRQGLDIRCLRLKPYRADGNVFVDVTQIIPLPESADYVTKLERQERAKRKPARAGAQIYSRYWSALLERAADRTQLLEGVSPSRKATISIPTEATGVRFLLRVFEHDIRVLCIMDFKVDGERKRKLMEGLHAKQDELEASFGRKIDWLCMTSKSQRKIRSCIPGGWSLDEAKWPEVQDQAINVLIRLESLLHDAIQSLKS